MPIHLDAKILLLQVSNGVAVAIQNIYQQRADRLGRLAAHAPGRRGLRRSLFRAEKRTAVDLPQGTEPSRRHLRSRRAEDVVFAGSERRRSPSAPPTLRGDRRRTELPSGQFHPSRRRRCHDASPIRYRRRLERWSSPGGRRRAWHERRLPGAALRRRVLSLAVRVRRGPDGRAFPPGVPMSARPAPGPPRPCPRCGRVVAVRAAGRVLRAARVFSQPAPHRCAHGGPCVPLTLARQEWPLCQLCRNDKIEEETR